MSNSPIFLQGRCLVVTTHGRGKLHVLNYQSNGGLTNNKGFVTTTNSGVTRFMVSFSHTYEKFAYYWDGSGEAVYSIGTDLQRQPLGRSWSSASQVMWGSATVTTANVTSITSAIVSDATAPTCFVIPDEI